MSWVDAIGAVAAVLSVLSLAPQVVKTWRTRSADDLSYLWLLLALCATLLWTAYGTIKADWAVFAANFLVAVLVVMLIAMKKAYRRRT